MSRRLCFVWLLAVVLVLVSGLVAQTDQTLYSFSGAADGGNPISSLAMDPAGNLYGTTFVSGASNAGVVYELSPNGNGGWTQTVLYSFTGGADGANPYYADVILDKAGNLYGTTVGGGANNLGVVFELSPNGNGGWTETVLHSFAGGIDGENPYSGLVLDPFGNLYGTTYGGGAYGVGTVFQLKHGSVGQWTEKVIYTFDVKTGRTPIGALVFDRKGDLFGTTYGGGTYKSGVVFALQYTGKDTWTARVIHNFTGPDGAGPYAERLIFDKAGNLYGTTLSGGTNFWGVVFKLFQTSTGWKEQVLYRFNGAVESNPYAGVIMDGAGNLYGTCANGNMTTTVGSIYKLTPSGGGKYTESDLYLFTGKDGQFPESALLRDKAGNLYGTTLQGGGPDNMGVVFELSK